jgi:hypothetical protein
LVQTIIYSKNGVGGALFHRSNRDAGYCVVVIKVAATDHESATPQTPGTAVGETFFVAPGMARVSYAIKL